MTRVLYVGSGNPWSGGAGYLVRQNLFLRALAEVADLHLAMFDASPSNRPPFPCEFTVLPSPKRKPSNRWKLMLSDWRSPLPRMVHGYDLKPPRQAIAALRPETFDAAFVYRIEFGHYAGVLKHRQLILDIDDPEHIRWQRRIHVTTNTEGDWRTRNDLAKLRQFECSAVAGAKMAFVCQENDQSGWPVTPKIIPNCVEVMPSPKRSVATPRLLFVGNCAGGANTPNVDAVRFFLNDIWPAVVAAVPEAEFQIVGPSGKGLEAVIAEAKQRHPAAMERVLLSGFVTNLAEVYAQAAASVAPIRFGTGTRVKILEAFAHACPVVSTLAGAEGIVAIPGKEIELAADPKGLAARCIELLKNPVIREEIGQGGYALASRLYDRQVQQTRLQGMLTELFAANAARSSAVEVAR